MRSGERGGGGEVAAGFLLEKALLRPQEELVGFKGAVVESGGGLSIKGSGQVDGEVGGGFLTDGFLSKEKPESSVIGSEGSGGEMRGGGFVPGSSRGDGNVEGDSWM